MLSRILVLFGSCSKRTSSTSTVSRLSPVSVRNSRSRSSMDQGYFRRNTQPAESAPAGNQIDGGWKRRHFVAKRFNFGCNEIGSRPLICVRKCAQATTQHYRAAENSRRKNLNMGKGGQCVATMIA